MKNGSCLTVVRGHRSGWAKMRALKTFRNSGIQIRRETMTADRYYKEKEEMRKKLSVLKPALVNKKGPILLYDNAKPHASKNDGAEA
uniref:DDE_3 domain-containing protein n=1 Tax=Strongyloides papillosus TaxID=174720 RepID=A0A0N5BRM5_STREA